MRLYIHFLSLVLCPALTWAHPTVAYYEHPVLMQQALLSCPSVQPPHMTCEALSQLAKDTSDLILALGQNPQKFGLNILRIQENIARQQIRLDKTTLALERDILLQHLNQEQQDLMLRLALIRSLLSPQGVG